MPTRRLMFCNNCRAQLVVSFNVQLVVCPACRMIINGYGGGQSPNQNYLLSANRPPNNNHYPFAINGYGGQSPNQNYLISTNEPPNNSHYPFAINGYGGQSPNQNYHGYANGHNHHYPFSPPRVQPPLVRPNCFCDEQPPPPPPPRKTARPVYGRKRAVICGVTYRGQKASLDGSINNAMSMKNFLVHHRKFPESSIIILTEDEKDPSRIPTKLNIQAALKELVQGCQTGDSLVFYYSGHASRERDFDGDEIDGFDEVLCPLDYKTAGKIADDEINETIVRPLPPGARLHAIIDTCFSGTLLDLSYMSRMNRNGEVTWEDHHIEYADYKGTNGGIAISISACDDHQNAGDTTAFTGNTVDALTYSFIQTMTNEPKLTYGRLLKSMRYMISGAQKTAGQPPQEPQLSSSEKFDIHSKPLIL